MKLMNLALLLALAACSNSPTPPASGSGGGAWAESREQVFSDVNYLRQSWWSYAIVTVESVAPQSEWFVHREGQALWHQPTRVTIRSALPLWMMPDLSATHYDWGRSSPEFDFDGSYARSLPVAGRNYLLGVERVSSRPDRVMVSYAFTLDAQFRTEVPIYGHPAGTPAEQVLAYIAQVWSSDAGPPPMPTGNDAAAPDAD